MTEGLVVNFHGKRIPFGDRTREEMNEYLRGEQEKLDRAKGRILAEEIAKMMPEPEKGVDYSNYFVGLGTILVQILEKQENDYTSAFDDLVKAIKSIPEPKDVDLSPVVKAVGDIDVNLDTSNVESELKNVVGVLEKSAKLQGELVNRDTKVVVQQPPEEPKPRIKSFGAMIDDEWVEVSVTYEDES